MSNEKEVSSDAPPVYSTPTAVKDETPINQRSTAPAPVPVLVPVAPVGQQYMFASCDGGHHEPTTKYGTCGIITAIVCFPIGLLCLCADKETRCARCGALLY